MLVQEPPSSPPASRSQSAIRSPTWEHLVHQDFFFGILVGASGVSLRTSLIQTGTRCSPTLSHIRSPPNTGSPQEAQENDHRVLPTEAKASGLLTSARVWKACLPSPVHLPRGAEGGSSRWQPASWGSASNVSPSPSSREWEGCLLEN